MSIKQTEIWAWLPLLHLRSNWGSYPFSYIEKLTLNIEDLK